MEGERDSERRLRDEALADNVVMLERFRLIRDAAFPDERDGMVRRTLNEPHPGAALLEELDALRGVRAQAQVDAKFIHEALGWAGEWPRSLPAPSRAVVALLEQHRKEVAALKADLAKLEELACGTCSPEEWATKEARKVAEVLKESKE